MNRNFPSQEAANIIRAAAVPIGPEHGVRPILDFLGDTSVVLLGEATHGTNDFYVLRAAITRALIEQKGFGAVAIEGDWPDAYRVHRYVQGFGSDTDASRALRGFERFPTWMWRNTAVSVFVAWLRAHNAGVDEMRRAGFFGLDLYSLHASMRAVINYLESRDPAAAEAARQSYGCFEEFGHDTDSYAWAASRMDEGSCEDAVARELIMLQRRRSHFVRGEDILGSDAFFDAEQNARLARNAEQYYRTMFRGRVNSWNLRDTHMAETLEHLREHLRRRGQPDKVVVWAHNSHLGDARATEMGERGEVNLGQLARQKYGGDVKLIGFTTSTGTVMAASDWGDPPQVKRVRPALPRSYEDLFHETGVSRFFLPILPGSNAHTVLMPSRLERAIGVIYRPETERQSHYFEARLADQFDAVIHCDETRAVDALERRAPRDHSEVPETFPSGV